MKKKSNWLLLVFLTVCIIGISLSIFSLRVYAWEIDRTGNVTYIVDDDTLDVSGVGRIRLADIDCPEPGEPGASAASQYLSSLVYQEKVYIDVDDITGTDPYGRIVAVIYVYYDATRLKNVNKALLVLGHAEIWDFDNNEFNPYNWTLYVMYQSDPPPDPPPPPPAPPDDPTPSDNNSNLFMAIGVGIGGFSIFVVVIIGLYYSNNSKIQNNKSEGKQKKVLLKDKFKEVKRRENNIIDPIVHSIVTDLLEQYSSIIIAIYGIGSYFDDSLPPTWVKNDVDIVVIVKSLKEVPKRDWTEVRYEENVINGIKVWKGFNTIESYQDRNKFKKKSFSNHEWSLIELKYPDNSKLLYGQDIRNKLPDISSLAFDYDDILARSLYHLDNSLKESKNQKEKNSQQEFSKGVFKFGFYICILKDKSFFLTSQLQIAHKLEQLAQEDKIKDLLLEFIWETIVFRMKGEYDTEFKSLQTTFILHIFSLLAGGSFHRKMNFKEIIVYLKSTYRGLFYLVSSLSRAKKGYYEQRTEIKFTRRWHLQLQTYRKALDIPKDIIQDTIAIFKTSRMYNLLLGRSIDTVLPASIYCAYKVNWTPIAIEDLAKVCRIPKKQLSSSYKSIVKEVLPKLKLSFQVISVEQYIQEFAQQLGVSETFIQNSIELYRLAKKNGMFESGKDPRGIAAAVIYICANNMKEFITQKKISKLAHITEVTLRMRIKEINRFL